MDDDKLSFQLGGIQLSGADIPLVDPFRLGDFLLQVPADVRLVRTPSEGGPTKGTDYPYLAFRYHGVGGDQVVDDPRGCLAGFIRLHDASVERVLDFARMWGPLGLCKTHHKPYAHGIIDRKDHRACELLYEHMAGPAPSERISQSQRALAKVAWLQSGAHAPGEVPDWARQGTAYPPQLLNGEHGKADPDQGGIVMPGGYVPGTKLGLENGHSFRVKGDPIIAADYTYFEPLSAWYRFSRQLRAVLLVIAGWEQGTVGGSKLWQEIADGEPDRLQTPQKRQAVTQHYHSLMGRPAPSVEPFQHEKALVDDVLVRWEQLGGLKLCRVWRGGRQFVTMALTLHQGMAGILAAELDAAAASPKGIFQCDDCSSPYVPKMRAKSKQHHFCPECCSPGGARNDVASKKLWARRHRANEREKKRLKLSPESGA